ncbi:hypothetical protein BU25DRAFT_475058 [Macroventuria anomochaeta]|uniref:Uncharacterized protein n=1 Tax=Macroventuria anomochaeta TaxID=301207 RepID=A0ACB6SCF4_9PLEO|nr:uncharacterized protein BU25DRAFT_475058 [Macroventuria anomochaeta]KAF2631980.1 hypothetical protein BU25DRAFT_475058 [Macroventuria anomochaeta]
MCLTLQTNVKNSAILALPRELRNQIYHEWLRSTPSIWTHYRLSPDGSSVPVELYHRHVARDPDAMPSIGLPPWLLACKTFLQEGMAEFDSVFDSTIGPHYDYLSKKKRAKLVEVRQLVNPASRGTLTISIDTLSTSDKPTYDHGACFELGETGIRTIDHVLHTTVVERGESLWVIRREKLHTLRVKAAFVNVCTYCQRYIRRSEGPEVWELDLSSLEHYETDLDVFELEVTHVDTKAVKGGYEHLANCWDRAQGAFKEEVERVGKVLTQDYHGNVQVNPTSTSPRTTVFRFEKSEECKLAQRSLETRPR